MTEITSCSNTGCVYNHNNECSRTTAILDAEGQCTHKDDRITIYDKGAGESSWHEELK